MIKCDFANVSWRGPKIILQAEVSTLLHSMIKNGVFTPEEIDDIVADAKKTEEQIAEEVEALEKEATPGQVAFASLMSEFLASVGDADLSGLFS